MSTPNTVVRYRGIIQDMHNTELVTANYLYKEPGRDDCDLVSGGPMVERELYYCIPIPCETKWSRHSFYPDKQNTTPSTCNKKSQNTKRKRNEDLEEDHEMSDEIDPKKRQHHHYENFSIDKRKISDRDEMLDFPIKGETGLACLVKLYGDNSFKNTELVDFVGILTFESSLMCDDEDEDFCYFRPEATLVPRLHVLFFKKHKSVFDIVGKMDCSLMSARNQLLEYLTLALGGDKLIAELLLYHLISRV